MHIFVVVNILCLFYRKMSTRRKSRFSIPSGRRMSYLHPVSESSSENESSGLLHRSNSSRRLSTHDKVNSLQKLHRSLSEGRILPYDAGAEEEEDTGRLIQEETSQEGTVTHWFPVMKSTVVSTVFIKCNVCWFHCWVDTMYSTCSLEFISIEYTL